MPDQSPPATGASPKTGWATEVRARLASLRLSPTRESEIVDELSQHLDDRYRELIAGGASPEDATRLTLGEFQSGNVLAQYMAPLRQAHPPAPIALGAPTGHLLSDLWHDVRYAARIFWKQPAFAATAVLTLALGIGATTAIFSVVYGVLLKPLPFNDPDRLVTVRQFAPHGAGTNQGPATFLSYRANQRSFEAIGAWDTADVSITGRGDPERVQALAVTAATLSLLRVQPIVGHAFDADDDRLGRSMRVMLTYGYWQRRFGGVALVASMGSSVRALSSMAHPLKSLGCCQRHSASCAPAPKSWRHCHCPRTRLTK
jgi:putative ABC transport system permease protein